jgi:hypothetical protein
MRGKMTMKIKNPLKKKIKEEPKEVRYVTKEIVGETIKIQDIENFFKYNVNPALIEAKIEKSVAMQMRDNRGIPIKWVMMFAFVIIAVGIAYMLITGATSQSSCNADLRSCYATCKATANILTQSTVGSSAASIT